MYLHSLEIQGFKSFANRTVIEFHRGVTAIVGPNGCGKSNVLDAIRWVLGEQSAKALRGGEMADVIFSGTDARQAVGMAEVSMTFAECEQELGLDYHEVRITRRVFRDGRSEYLLNKAACRLRDIHLLFMDTGIGRSAYSIMEQGKIDQILSSRPEDRRAIFEEAAGITKYKSQKKEALRKLEFTEANLLRLTDIIKEVKRQIGSLQRQAGKARRYQALTADLRLLDTHLSRRKLDELDAGAREIEQQLRDLAERHEDGERQLAQREEALGGRKTELAEMETRIADARQRVQELRNDITGGESRIGFNRERMVEFASLAERYRLDLAGGEEKLTWQEQQMVETDQQIEATSEVLAGEEARLAAHSEAVAALRQKRQEAETALRQTDTTLSQTEGRSNALRTELATLLGQRESTDLRVQTLARELSQMSAHRDGLASQLASLREQQTAASNRLGEHRETARQQEEQLKSAQMRLQTAEQELTRAHRAVAEHESRLGVLRQLNEEGAGLGGGTQAVLRGLDQPELYKPALLGSLASQLETEPEFIAAIEAALGQHLQAVLLKETELAGRILETLLAKKQGRAALAPLEFLPPATAQARDFLPEGALGWALDKIKVEGPARPLIHRLLEQVLVVDGLEDACRLKPLHPGLTFATLNGTLLTADGVILGGQTADVNNSVLARRNQIKDLESLFKTARAAFAEAENKRQKLLDEVEKLRTSLQEARDLVQEAHLAASALQSQMANVERDWREAEKRLRELDWERTNLEKRRETTGTTIAQNELQLGELAAVIAAQQARRLELQAILDSARDEENRFADTLGEARVRVATERQQQENLRRQRQPMAARIVELRELIAQRKNDIRAYTERVVTLETEIAGITERVAKAKEAQSSAERVFGELQAERAALVQAVEGLERHIQQARREAMQAQEERGRCEVRETQLQLRREHLLEHVQRRYQCDLREVELDHYAFQVAVRDLRKKALVAATPPSQEVEATPSSQEVEATPSSPRAEEEARGDGTASTFVDEGVVATEDWSFVEATVAELTSRADAMGPVNLEAIQEFEELEAREKFLDEQNSDLTKSKAELLEVIAKINHTTKQLFADTFEQVRLNFQEMFTELFGGGKADLVLVDDADPLESGIDIIAKPPGKQLQSISLLSGGEKTMTAVALLFSIYMVKPSPFCVLDEMDAPLDESNINRFIKILDRFVGQSQFVVITHNKRTIAKADILYGVTMEEQGVSKLVGVRLSKRTEPQENADLAGTSRPQPELVPSIAESFGKSGNLHSDP